MGTLMTPLLKQKVDELFFNWFSEASMQKELRKELHKITLATNSPMKAASSPLNGSSIGLNINTRPSSPPIPPSSPTSTPRSPRRRINSQLSRDDSKKSLRYFFSSLFILYS